MGSDCGRLLHNAMESGVVEEVEEKYHYSCCVAGWMDVKARK